jgi:hypothetical protein
MLTAFFTLSGDFGMNATVVVQKALSQRLLAKDLTGRYLIELLRYYLMDTRPGTGKMHRSGVNT